jgi:hypothetical protein
MRGYGNGSVSFEHREPCNGKPHDNCVGRWTGTLYTNDARGEPKRERVAGFTEEECWSKLAAKRAQPQAEELTVLHKMLDDFLARALVDAQQAHVIAKFIGHLSGTSLQLNRREAKALAAKARQIRVYTDSIARKI